MQYHNRGKKIRKKKRMKMSLREKVTKAIQEWRNSKGHMEIAIDQIMEAIKREVPTEEEIANMIRFGLTDKIIAHTIRKLIEEKLC